MLDDPTRIVKVLDVYIIPEDTDIHPGSYFEVSVPDEVTLQGAFELDESHNYKVEGGDWYLNI